MKIKFAVNQRECFRQGIDAPESYKIIEIDPATLDVFQRNALADRLVGIELRQLRAIEDGEQPTAMYAFADTEIKVTKFGTPLLSVIGHNLAAVLDAAEVQTHALKLKHINT